jgi:hypothetical protein
VPGGLAPPLPLGERTPPSAATFLGGRVDDALSSYHRQQLEHGQTLTLDQLHDASRDHWTHELAAEEARHGIVWDAEFDEPRAFTLGLDALTLALAELVPAIGRPAAVQRKVEYALAPGLEWTVQCYLDFETLRPGGTGAEAVPAIVDYKVKSTLHTQAKADQDAQAGLYLAGRWLEGDPAHEFTFAQIRKQGPRRKQMSASLVTTRRTPGQLRAILARIAQAATQIDAYHRRFGPDEPWGFADPSGWKCSPRYCDHHAACPGGGGL